MFSKFRTLAAIVCIVLLTIGAHYLGLLQTTEAFFRRSIMPGSSALYSWSLTVAGNTETFSRVEDLQKAYADLKQISLRNLIDHAKLTSLEDENTLLRNQLSFVQTQKLNTIGADVIGKQIDPMGSTIMINRGAQDGLKEGDPVIVDAGVLIGKIAEVNDTSAMVRLITDNQSRIAAMIQNQNHSIGLVEGGYGLSVQMSFVPQNELIRVGDIVVTSGLEKGMPRGLVLGTVESVEKEVYEPFQRAVITSPINLQQLSVVGILHQ